MYWDKIKAGFLEVEEIKRFGEEKLLLFAEKCRKELYDKLDEDGIVLLEQLICSLELLENGRGDPKNK